MFIFAKLLNMIAAILDFAGKLWHGTVGLSVDNLYAKFHEILIKIKRVLGPNRVNMNGFLETGSAGTGS